VDLLEAINKRHSVRSYEARPLNEDTKAKLLEFINGCNEESGLSFKLVANEPKAFNSLMAHYGKFSGVTNYVVLAGKKSKDIEEKCGYYGEKIVLFAQTLGLNTCWVAMTYGKGMVKRSLKHGEKLCTVIALGYGVTEGVPHKSKAAECVISAKNPPEWFMKGVNAALLAPTAMNQQKFTFSLNGNVVSAKAGSGFYTKTDLGIVKYHFELGAGKENFVWGK